MTLQNDALVKPHILKHFDVELIEIHRLTLDMIGLILDQWELTIEAMDEANLELALDVIAQTADVRSCEAKIDQAILTFLARENPVASDLRMALSISKISAVMKYLGNEMADIAKLILVLYEPRNGTPTAQLVTDVVKICRDIQTVLGNLVVVLSNLESNQARLLLKNECDSCQDIQEAIKHQFAHINQDLRQIRPALTILQIMNSLEICGDHCKNMAEYSIFMIDGQDVRHLPLTH